MDRLESKPEMTRNTEDQGLHLGSVNLHNKELAEIETRGTWRMRKPYAILPMKYGSQIINLSSALCDE